jgi:predicted metalloprotease with PDZ domain
MNRSLSALAAVAVLVAVPRTTSGQTAAALPTAAAISYDVSFENVVHHEARVTMTVPDVPAGPLELWMSRSSPGRYALHEFAKNVYSVEAADGSGAPLRVVRTSPYAWTVPEHGDVVKVSYTLYADRAGGTYTGIDRTHAHMNMPATFMFAPDLQDRPILLTLHPLDGWKVATQLPAVPGDLSTFSAPDLQYFMDSPTELSAYDERSWTVDGGRTIRITMHHLGTAAELDDYTEKAKRITAAQMRVFGEYPDYDYGTYTFIADYLPWVSGDGMEHRNSTIISSTGSLAENERGLLHTLAHEYFHSWNMERIRADEIEPFDFLHADPSPELWFGEGFTNFYDGLSMKRAGVIDLDAFLGEEGGAINFVTNFPGRRYHSAAGMSLLAPFVDAASSIDPTNFANTFISYYTWGEAIAIGLDLELRTRFDRTLDDYMRAMWRKYGKTGRPYDMDGLRTTLGEVAGDQAWADEFFRRYVTGHEVVDYAALLGHAGLLLRPARPDRPWLGYVGLDYGSEGAEIRGNTLVGQPLYEAGLDRDDVILSIDGTPMTDAEAFEAVRGRHRVGDAVDIRFRSRGEDRTATVTFAADPTLELVSYENSGRTTTPEMLRFREAWVGE